MQKNQRWFVVTSEVFHVLFGVRNSIDYQKLSHILSQIGALFQPLIQRRFFFSFSGDSILYLRGRLMAGIKYSVP
jgi:hypothetical protein